jgi:hypothetical protein
VTTVSSIRRQCGAASLLVALVLVMASTLITLTVAHTHLVETRISGNEDWHRRLLYGAESAWEQASATLVSRLANTKWTNRDGNMLIGQDAPVRTGNGLETHVLYRRADASDPFVHIQASAGSGASDSLAVVVSQRVRLLSVLSPLAESAPPLVINGCLYGAGAVEVNPANSVGAVAADALWQYRARACPAGIMQDLHGGRTVTRSTQHSLWETFFSITPDAYERLAASELVLPASQRRHWQARSEPGTRLVWNQSLGSAEAPVVLHIPDAAGCPQFAAGVRIFGFVFIDASCVEPLADHRLDIIGTLVVDGNINTGHALIRLQHIGNVDSRQTRLSLPILRTVRVPGDWRDF